MLEKINFLILLFIAGIAGSYFYQNSQSCSVKKRSSSQKYELSIDSRGRLVDPYLQREMKNTINYHAREVQVCYNQFIKRSKNNTKSDGFIHLDWMINPQGQALKTRVIQSNFADSPLKTCITQAMQKWEFPAPGQQRYAEHRFNFSKNIERLTK